MKIPITQIYSDPNFNSRKGITKQNVFNLAMNIKELGLMNPISAVLMPDGRYRVLAGNRRFTAIKEWLLGSDAKWDYLDINIIEGMDDDTQRLYNLSENLQRADLTLEEEAYALQTLFNKGTPSYVIAEKINRSTPWVIVRKNFLELPRFAQVAVGELNLTQNDIKDLISMEESEMRVAIDNIRTAQMKNNKVPSVKDAVRDKKRVSQTVPHQVKTRQEILQNQEYLRMLYPNFWDESYTFRFFCSAGFSWCAGEISDAEYFMKMQEWARNEGLEAEAELPNERKWLEKMQQRLPSID